MIIHMNSTSSADIVLRMDDLRETVGSVALGRVLTLIVVAKDEGGLRDAVAPPPGGGPPPPPPPPPRTPPPRGPPPARRAMRGR